VTVELTEALEDISLDDNHPDRITCISTQVGLLVRRELEEQLGCLHLEP